MTLTKNQFKEDFIKKLISKRGKSIKDATLWDKYSAFGSLIRDYIAENWVKTNEKYISNEKKQVYYFSMEFLMGKLLENNLINLGIKEICEEGLKDFGIDLSEIEKIENDPGLGNGGLGRLAACFLDSMASLGIPGHGSGIRYKYGLFEQKIIDGYQVEFPDKWLQCENIWEIKKPSKSVEVRFGGNVRIIEENNKLKFIHENYESILAVPYDTPILGYENNKVNTLRLWSAEGIKKEFDYEYFNKGEYTKAFENKYSVESISHVLYPNDSYDKGRLLRLKQEYFFVSAGVQSIVRLFKKLGKPINKFNEYIAIHINDTHPALAIPELMRILIDEEGIGWDEAWKITKNTISYTNHTIMSEALEKWNIDVFKSLLPRIFMIIEEINERFCKYLWDNKYTGDFDKISKMAVIADGQIRMANLAIVGSHSINGVAKLHTEILKKQELKDFYDIYPNKFNNKTNGISHRRWLLKSNPKLSNLITETIGSKWINFPEQLMNLIQYKQDSSFQEKIYDIKQYNKNKLANMINEKYSINIDPNSIFDIQAKRIHEYKRQKLNVLHIMHLYNRLIENPDLDIVPRTFIFAGKAAPGYYIAKQTIKLINTLADKINNDKRIKDKLKVIFIENYGVTLAELMIPAANVSEQIATTTKEASGTGNMKFMMNGAITIATFDGANIEIADAVGEDNIIIFGLKDKEIFELYKNRLYKSIDIYNEDIRIKTVVDQLVNRFFPVKNDEFSVIYDSLLKYNDEFFVLKDFDAYVGAQQKIDKLYRSRFKWLEMSIANIANSGKFSSDKTIHQYATEIWDVGSILDYY
ncbi:glycogen/starch/alpha-glucan phosphorylase [Tepidibacter formicigenes]|jgi:starch phosphorylase|uniref:Alpha-1,4 glucan phosphorylase n=1 Tax=Tepidibacter formicigenes DSM 15518 TaxID=1123349 RepID=A0A1M6SJC4_9FIRM|nr:glycogen/starch/alpha-glucan phosphorylase [Tepidibacter formicigenes]SHK44805.1 starch phosphorylase [Tepidibacter formicigenes DSM 15518]